MIHNCKNYADQSKVCDADGFHIHDRRLNDENYENVLFSAMILIYMHSIFIPGDDVGTRNNA